MKRIAYACGRVEFGLRGEPMATVVCYGDTCQERSRAIERLPNAPAVLDDDGGTAYVLYRKDRVTCLEGAQRLATIASATPAATGP